MSLTFVSRTAFKHLREVNKCFFNQNLTRSVGTKPKEVKLYNFKDAATAVAIGAVAVGGYSFYRQRESGSSLNEEILQNNLKISSFPKVEISKKVVVPNDASGLQITLFQYPTCPFCCKVRAFLDFYGISYDVVEVDPVFRQQLKWSSHKEVPIVLVKSGNNYLQFNDSAIIISALATYFKDRYVDIESIQECYPISQDLYNPKKMDIRNRYFVMDGKTTEEALERDEDERKWRKWADYVLVYMLSSNVYRTPEETLEVFVSFAVGGSVGLYIYHRIGKWQRQRLFSTFERALIFYVDAMVMRMTGKKLQIKRNLKEDVRESLYEKCNEFMRELETRRTPFLGGKDPNLADLAVYGVLSSIEGCFEFGDLLKHTNIGSWYYEMKKAVQNHKGQIFLM